MLLLAAILCAGCGQSAITAPSASAPTAQLSLVVSGQSNAGYDPNPVYPMGYAGLGEALMPLAKVRRVAQGALPISGFASVQSRESNLDWLWPALAAMLAAPEPIDAFVWVHGESDAIDDKLSPLYYAAALDLFGRVRAAARQPNLLIVITGLPDFNLSQTDLLGDRARWDRMRAIQQQLARDVPHAVYINTVDLVNGGGQHFSPVGGYDIIAQRVIEAVRKDKLQR